MKALVRVVLGIQLLSAACSAGSSPGAASTDAPGSPTTPADIAEQSCPACVERLLAPLRAAGLDVRLGSKAASRLAAEVARLADQEAAVLGKSRDEVIDQVEAVVRARGSGRRWPRFDPGAFLDSEFAKEGMQLASRMIKLLRRFASAYVTLAADNIQSSESSATSQQSLAPSGSQPTASDVPTATPAATPPPAADARSASKIMPTSKQAPAPNRAKTRTRSSSSESGDDDDDEKDDDNDRDDDDDNDDESDSADGGKDRDDDDGDDGNKKRKKGGGGRLSTSSARAM